MFFTIRLLNLLILGGGLILFVLKNNDHGRIFAFLCSIQSVA